jgi:hypothetical protein
MTNKPKEELLPATFVNRLKTSLREKIDPSEDPEQAEQMRELINMKIKRLQETYPDWRIYQTFYILSGQPVPHDISKVDFPDDDSVIKFIEGF